MSQFPPKLSTEVISLHRNASNGTQHWQRTWLDFNTQPKIRQYLKYLHDCNDGHTDGVCTLEVEYNSDPHDQFSDELTCGLIEVLPRLRNLDNLNLHGCFEQDFSLIASPPHFPRLTTLSCDFPPSRELEHFFANNPTIQTLYFEGYDLNYLGRPDPKLRQELLPRLKNLRCDVLLLTYFAPHRPIQWVFPANSDGGSFELGLSTVLDSLRLSTATGGVKVFWMEIDYPLEWLANIAPNLETLHLVEDDKSETVSCFWTTPLWERGLVLFNKLKNIQIHTSVTPSGRREQRDLLARWRSVPHRLSRVTFGQYRGAMIRQDDDDYEDRKRWDWNGREWILR